MTELNYTSYLKVDELLELQKLRSEPAEHDETLFIIIHQTYELWFKQLLHEFDKVKTCFSENELFAAIHTFKRSRMIMKTLVGQVDILETMTPMSFLGFRERLETASGFQSVQFRELEYMLGYKRADMMQYHEEGSPGHQRLLLRLGERSVVDHFYDFLEHRGVEIPRHLRERPAPEPSIPDPDVQGGIIQLYRSAPDVAILLELMTDFDEGFQEWRYRHVKLVERTVGYKKGTGGSLGVPFLKRTLFSSVFEDLWAIRHAL